MAVIGVRRGGDGSWQQPGHSHQFLDEPRCDAMLTFLQRIGTAAARTRIARVLLAFVISRTTVMKVMKVARLHEIR
jgi:hypothetical protein